MTLKVIHQLQAFLYAICRTFMQHFTRFQPTVCSHGPSALAELLVWIRAYLRRICAVKYHETDCGGSCGNFYRASSYASAVLGVVILFICLSVTRVLCDKTKQCAADILIQHERAITP